MASKYIVRHGAMRFLGEYEAVEGTAYGRGDDVVIRSDRGLEIGQVLCDANPRAVELIKEKTHIAQERAFGKVGLKKPRKTKPKK